MTDDINPVGALAPLVGYHLRRASAAFTADFARAVDGTGMRQVLIGILAIVADEPGINQGAVGRLLGIKRANMVSLINELVDWELIAREADPGDRRAFALKTTEAGRKMLATCLARIDVHERGRSRASPRPNGLCCSNCSAASSGGRPRLPSRRGSARRAPPPPGPADRRRPD